MATPDAKAAAKVAPDASADASASVTIAPKQLSQAPLQKRGCSRLDDSALPGSAHQLLLPAQDSGFHALVLHEDRQTLAWWSGALGASVAPAATRKLATRVAKLSLLRKAADLYTVAWVDEQGSVWTLSHAAGAFSEPKLIAKGADRRFAPALYEDGAISLLAYTATVDGAMHTWVARSQNGPGNDITPQGHGAAAPSFVLGAKQPELVFVDAHEGVSPLLEVGFDAELAPQPATVRTPISQPYTPPLLRAFLVPDGEAEVAFTAVGKLAATAVGRVPLRRALSAVALHPSRGYGELMFDVTVSGRAAIFALEVPLDEKPNAARGIEIKWLDKSGEGVALMLTKAPSPSALRPSVARTPLAGEVLVGYVVGTVAHVARLRCDA